MSSNSSLTMNATTHQQFIKKKRKKSISVVNSNEENKENNHICSITDSKKELKKFKFAAGSSSASGSPLITISNVIERRFDMSRKPSLIEADTSSMDSGYQSSFSPLKQTELDDESIVEQLSLDDQLIINSPNRLTHQFMDLSNCSSLNDSSLNTSYGARRCLFKSKTEKSILKTPKNQSENRLKSSNTTPVSIHRISDDLSLSQIFEKSFTEPKNLEPPAEIHLNHENIKQSLEIDLNSGTKLIGDRSRGYCLPCQSSSKHHDLNAITPQTLCSVLNGDFNDKFDKLIIIDARYPYEFNGGHIENALNVYTREALIEVFINNRDGVMGKDSNKRTLLLFHCEFSSERGPALLRFLRNQDRDLNRDFYPKLFYPELYLLEGGYKAFYEYSKMYCEPKVYVPMDHPQYFKELKHFRAKTKTWQASSRHCASAIKSNTNLVSRLQRCPRSTLF